MNSSQKAAALALINLSAEEDTSYDESEKIEVEGMENGEDSVESDFPPSRYTQKRCCVIFKSEYNDIVATRSKANRSHVHKSTAVFKKKTKSPGSKTPASTKKTQASKHQCCLKCPT